MKFKVWGLIILAALIAAGSESAIAAMSRVNYVVYKDGSAYKARNEATGTVDYSGDDAALAIQKAIDAVHAGGGGKVFLKESLHGAELNSGLKMPLNASIALIGEEPFVMLIKHFNGDMLTAGKGRYIIKNLALDGNRKSYSGDGIVIKGDGGGGSNQHIFENLFIIRMKEVGLRLIGLYCCQLSNVHIGEGCKVGLYIDSCSTLNILNSEIWNNLQSGVEIATETLPHYTSTNINFIGGSIGGNQYGVKANGAYAVNFSGTHMEANSINCIALQSVRTSVITGCTLSQDTKTPVIRGWGAADPYGAWNVHIFGNQFGFYGKDEKDNPLPVIQFDDNSYYNVVGVNRGSPDFTYNYVSGGKYTQVTDPQCKPKSTPAPGK